MRHDVGRKADGDAGRPDHQEQGDFRRQEDGFLVAPVVAGHEGGGFLVEKLFAREVGEAALDVTGGGGGGTGEDVAEVPLSPDQVALALFLAVVRVPPPALAWTGGGFGRGGFELPFLLQVDERVGDGGVAVRMVRHDAADDGGDLDRAAVVHLVERVENAPLDRFQPVFDRRDRAVADAVRGELQEVPVDDVAQRAAPSGMVAVRRRSDRDCFDAFGDGRRRDAGKLRRRPRVGGLLFLCREKIEVVEQARRFRRVAVLLFPTHGWTPP